MFTSYIKGCMRKISLRSRAVTATWPFSLPSASSLLKLLFSSLELFYMILTTSSNLLSTDVLSFEEFCECVPWEKNANVTPICEQSSTTVVDFVLISTLGIIGADHLKIS